MGEITMQFRNAKKVRRPMFTKRHDAVRPKLKFAALALALGLSSTACTPTPLEAPGRASDSAAAHEVSAIHLHLESVPSKTKCFSMRVAANGFDPISKYWSVAGKRKLDVDFKGAPVGKVEVSALAFESSCNDAKNGKSECNLEHHRAKVGHR